MIFTDLRKKNKEESAEYSPSPAKTNYSSTDWFMYKKTFLVVAALTILFAVLMNNRMPTFQLQRFWGAAGDFWQYQWVRAIKLFESEYNLFVYGTFLCGYISFWSVGLLYTFMDVTGYPKFIRKFKIQLKTNEPVETRKLLKTVALVHANQLISIPFIMLFHFLSMLRGYNKSEQLPTFYVVLYEVVAFILIEEVFFYYFHRLFHYKSLYKWIHKIHHEWQSPIAITALYCHPVEQVFANLTPIFVGPLIMGSHIATVWLWLAIAILSILNDHSGYHLPLLPSPEFHDYHHLKFNQCFGVLGILDLIHGTDERFRNSRFFTRHAVMLSFVSAREAFPVNDDFKSTKEKKIH